ncbi:MAG: hypothetical protein M0036_21120, partial [Desulfobacteraceae bacterium]|nr:hypothetical protein [Desulfobacteraceae bacterium]
AYSKNFDFDLQEVSRFETSYHIENMQQMLTHERYTFNLSESGPLLKKFMAYLAGLDAAFEPLRKKFGEENIHVMQELGGFIAPLSLYFVARRHRIEHIFFEPAYFRGRLFDVINSLDPIAISDTPVHEVTPECAAYIQQTIQEKKIVIPSKDKHHFADMQLTKICNASNLSKLFFKLKYKYIDGNQQEYDHIWNHTRRYLTMYYNRKRNGSLYVRFDKDLKRAPYVYFPFHVQLDYSLTVRSLQYLNQLALLEYVCAILPAGVMLLAKEHPASIGGFSHPQLKSLLKRFDNFHLVHPSENSYDIMADAMAVLTINSKVGAEALTAGKEVIAMGKSFYANTAQVHYIHELQNLGPVIQAIHGGYRKNNPTEVRRFFSGLWNYSYPTELYNMDDANIDHFASHVCEHVMSGMGVEHDTDHQPRCYAI